MTVLDWSTTPDTMHGPVLNVMVRLNRQGVARAEVEALAAAAGRQLATPTNVCSFRQIGRPAGGRPIFYLSRVGPTNLLVSGTPGQLISASVRLARETFPPPPADAGPLARLRAAWARTWAR